MNWLSPWWWMPEMPLSGDVSGISPMTYWLSPQIELNFKGDRKVEAKVISEVASYGKQLGLLTEAVLELAEGAKGDKVEKLRKIAEEIEEVKEKHRSSLEEAAREDLEKLKEADQEAYARLVQDLKP